MLLRELKNTAEVQELEDQLDTMLKSLGLDVEFSRHFVDRIMNRERKVTINDVTSGFDKLKKKYKNRLLSAKKKDNYEAVLKDFSKDLNIVFAIDSDELKAITIKSKDPSKFHTNTNGGEELKV